jgi:hypothetical protein
MFISNSNAVSNDGFSTSESLFWSTGWRSSFFCLTYSSIDLKTNSRASCRCRISTVISWRIIPRSNWQRTGFSAGDYEVTRTRTRHTRTRVPARVHKPMTNPMSEKSSLSHLYKDGPICEIVRLITMRIDAHWQLLRGPREASCDDAHWQLLTTSNDTDRSGMHWRLVKRVAHGDLCLSNWSPVTSCIGLDQCVATRILELTVNIQLISSEYESCKINQPLKCSDNGDSPRPFHGQQVCFFFQIIYYK